MRVVTEGDRWPVALCADGHVAGWVGYVSWILVLPKNIDAWSLTSLQQRLVKRGGRLVKHARYYWLLLAKSHLTRRLFGMMLRRIWALPVPAG
jgi:hypothetical protein